MPMRVHIALKGITDLDLLMAALREMGITNARTVPAADSRRAGNVLLHVDWGGYRMGFARDKNGDIQAVGDREAPLMRDAILQKALRQQYSLAAVKRKVVEMNYHGEEKNPAAGRNSGGRWTIGSAGV